MIIQLVIAIPIVIIISNYNEHNSSNNDGTNNGDINRFTILYL